MNMVLLRRLSFPFALLCLAAVAVHPGIVASKAVTPPAAAAAAATPPASAPPPVPTPAPKSTPNPAPTATPPTPAPSGTDQTQQPPAAADEGDFNDEPIQVTPRRHRHHHQTDRDLVGVGRGSHLPAGEKADGVVSVFGAAVSEGEAEAVVSVLGSTRVTGPVSESAVAVMGNNYVDSKVDGDVVAVLGNVELGPHAEIGGDVVSVLGTVTRDPAAIVHGDVNNVLNVDIAGIKGFSGLSTWINNCLLYGRPLAFHAGLGWAWTIALGLLAFYACLALMFRAGVEECVRTLETETGHTALAALIGILLTPVLFVLLLITVIGIAAIPFIVAALFCISLFGKAVVLAWLGGRVTGLRPGVPSHPAVAVLVGGAIALLLYVVPVVGFLVYKLLGFFGFGAVIYTLLLRMRARRGANGRPPNAYTSAYANATAAGPVDPGNAAMMAGPGWTAGVASTAGAASAASAGAAAAMGSQAAVSSQTAVPPSASPPGAPPVGVPPHITAVPPHITADLPRAGFWIRMGALALDVVLVSFAMGLLNPFGHHGDFHVIVLAIYGAVMWKLRGTTVGGIVCDLHVVRLDGRPVDWETAIVRALGCFLSLCVVFLGFIWIAFDPNRQAWHDKIAGTVVVRAKRGAPLI
jgi:uncharacterized RDD family membrane protein YckC